MVADFPQLFNYYDDVGEISRGTSKDMRQNRPVDSPSEAYRRELAGQRIVTPTMAESRKDGADGVR
jgi:hypothetical protein